MKYGIAFCHYEPHKQIVGDYELVEDASAAFSDKAERDAYAWFELEREFGTHSIDGYEDDDTAQAFERFKYHHFDNIQQVAQSLYIVVREFEVRP